MKTLFLTVLLTVVVYAYVPPTMENVSTDSILRYSILQPDSFKQWIDSSAYKLETYLENLNSIRLDTIYIGDTVCLKLRAYKAWSITYKRDSLGVLIIPPQYDTVKSIIGPQFTNKVDPIQYLIKSDSAFNDSVLHSSYENLPNIKIFKPIYGGIIGTRTFKIVFNTIPKDNIETINIVGKWVDGKNIIHFPAQIKITVLERTTKTINYKQILHIEQKTQRINTIDLLGRSITKLQNKQINIQLKQIKIY